MYLLYSFCFTLAFLVALPYFLVCGILHKKYFSSVRQRLGIVPMQSPGVVGGIWIHAVSVGEVLAVVPLAAALKRRWPDRPLYVSTTTNTGQALALQRLADTALVFYFPLDWRFAIRKSLDRLRPSLVIIAETEIWPNFLRECSLRRIRVLLVNGRISDRSFRRYSAVRWFIQDSLQRFSGLCMQTSLDGERIISLGAAPERTEVCGNLKYDVKPLEGISEKVLYFRRLLGLLEDVFLVAAGSTMKDEEPLVLQAFEALKRVCPSAVLLIAPRHPERFREVEQLLASHALRSVKRSTLEIDMVRLNPEVVLLDSMGELSTLYALADVVFIGGSLVSRGGHNLLEPALFAKPILFGPHMNNFKEMAEHFLRHQAAIQVSDAWELASRLVELSKNKRLRQETGENGYHILQSNSGATERILERVERLLSATVPLTPVGG
jgi:3-deoxy-D-manno-octulosonic-acid transferase